MDLWLARHAQTLADPGLCCGVTNVCASAPASLEAARQLAAKLPYGLSAWTSPLLRCRQLSRDLQTLRPDLEFTVDERLRELDFGRWEGIRWDVIGKDEVDRWAEDFGTYRFGGKCSVNEFLSTVAVILDEVVRQGRDALWVTHAGVIRAAGLLASGVSQITTASEWPVGAPAPGQWTRISFGNHHQQQAG
jgi:alpha-ribazole phosphatase